MGWAKTRPKGDFDNPPTHSKQDVILAGPDPSQCYLTARMKQVKIDLKSMPPKPKAFL